MRLTGLLGLLAFGNLVLSFAFQWFVVATLGAGSATDALVAAMILPQLVLAVFSGSLTQVLVPLFANLEGVGLRHAGWGFATVIGAFFALLAALLMATAPLWIPWTAPGFAAGQVTLTVELARIQLAGMVFIALTAVFTAVSHGRQRFLWAEGSALLAGTASLALLAWGLPRYGIVVAAWGLLLRSGLQALLLVPQLGRPLRPDWHRLPVRESWRRLGPLLFGTVYYKTDPLVDRVLTSLALPGSMTLLNLAQQLYVAGAAVLGKALAAPMIPRQARHAARGDWTAFRAVLARTLLASTGVALIGWLAVLVGGREGLALLFLGKLSGAEIEQLWWLLILLGGMWFGGGVGTVSSGAFYAQGDTRTPTRLGILTYTLYLPLKVLAFMLFGLTGLALSISAFYLLNLGLQVHYLGVAHRQRSAHAD